jgi:hypothetical protein
MPQALRLMLAVQEDGDKELAQVGTLGHNVASCIYAHMYLHVRTSAKQFTEVGTKCLLHVCVCVCVCVCAYYMYVCSYKHAHTFTHIQNYIRSS